MNNGIKKNVFILTLSGVVAKLFDFLFRAYYSVKLGTEGMGLLSLGYSLHSVMLTFATAGLGVAVSKTVSEYMERKNNSAVITCMRSAISGVLVLSFSVTILTFLFAEGLADNMLKEKRVSASLCALAPSVIFMGVSYCLKGFFYASRKTLPSATSEILEQIVKFISIKLLLKALLPYGIEYGCVAVFAGITIGEFSSCAYLAFFYIRDEKKFKNNDKASSKEIMCKLLGIAIPSMITSLCCSFLRMKEEVLIVSALEKGSMSRNEALKALGIIHGMTMPLLILPLNLMGPVMSFLVPEISRADVRGRARLCETAKKTYKLGGIMGGVVASGFLLFGGMLTRLIYKNDTAASLVVCLAPLCPVMFLDSLSFSMLNGIGKQIRILLITLLDFALRFSMIFFLLPYGKFTAFVLMTAISNIFTCMLSCGSVAAYISGGMKLTKRLKYGISKATVKTKGGV